MKWKKNLVHCVLWWLVLVPLWVLYEQKGPDWIWFLDSILHFLGGGVVAVMGLFVLSLLENPVHNRFILLWTLFASAGVIGIGWEWFYYSSEYFDTMKDLALNPIGALLAGMYYVFFYSGRD